MKPNRRGFFGVLASAPIAVKSAADAAKAEMSGLKLPPVSWFSPDDVPPSGMPFSNEPIPLDAVAKVLSDRQSRAQLESVLFEQERAKYGIFLDPDIACHRSHSLNAKIAFQRRRNVQRRLKSMTEGSVWNKAEKLLQKLTGIKGWLQ